MKFEPFVNILPTYPQFPVDK